MPTLISSLYISGWLVSAAGFALAFLLTPRAIRSVDSDKKRVESWYGGEYALLNDGRSSFPDIHALDLERSRRLRAARVPVSSAMGSGDLSEAARFTVERALRANVPSVAVALAGSFISTVGSVLSAAV